MARYDWLEQLRAEVRQDKFFVFEPAAQSALDEFERDHARLPEDYREFVVQFGQVTMFRDKYCGDRYSVRVAAPPNFFKAKGGTTVFKIGGTEWDDVCYHWKDGKWRENGAVYGSSFQRIAGSFQQWFERACQKARKYYSKQEWEIVKQPVAPFSEQEKRIVEAMSKFEFRQLGTTPEGKLLVEVQNNSEMELPWLDVAVRWPAGLGTCSIPIAGIRPGTTRVVTMKSPYADAKAPAEQIELLKIPLPGPADRQYSSVLRDLLPKQNIVAGQNEEFGDKDAKIPGLEKSEPSYGNWKFVHEIELDDLLRHPVWLWSMTLGLEDEDDGAEGGDETSMRPLCGSKNVKPEMVQPLILLKVKNSKHHVSGLYDTKLKKVVSLRWLDTSASRNESCAPGWPLTLVAVPRINGVRHAEFLWSGPEKDEAVQVP